MSFFDSIFSAEFIRAFAWTLLHSVWQGGLIALFAAWLIMILRRHRPGIRYGILYALLLLIPVFFVLTFILTYHPGNEGNLSGSFASVAPLANEAGISAGANSLSGYGGLYARLVHLFENHAGWLVMIWFIGFLFFLVRFTGSIFYVYRLKNYHVFPAGDIWNEKLSDLSHRIGLRKSVRLAESALARIPLTIGYLRPVILLPLGTLSGMPPQQIDVILMHELAHIMRKDYLLNIIQSVIELLFFYHPVTWWLSGMIRRERENICDDLVISIDNDHLNYIKALTTMEELNSKTPQLATAMTGSRKNLLLRVKRLLSPVKFSKGMSEGLIAFILLLGLMFALSFNALSFIPTAYDLTGRESGEKIYNYIPNPSDSGIIDRKTDPVFQTLTERTAVTVNPDTIIARSKSGKVIISVYTDSTSKMQQEQLNKMVEDMDRQSEQFDKSMEEYHVQIERIDNGNGRIENESKVIIIRDSDSTETSNDSVIVIYSDSRPPCPPGGRHFEMQVPECPPPVPPEPPIWEYAPQHGAVSPERIIRQELRDDGLIVPQKGYIVDIDSNGMYINGEKQSKNVYKKYKRLVESLDAGNIDGGEKFRLIF
jgi:beta-lactamase regulating signal transducer with metallopeptidase domain